MYVDNSLIMSDNSSKYMEFLTEYFLMEPESIRELQRYLGSDIKKIVNSFGKTLS